MIVGFKEWSSPYLEMANYAPQRAGDTHEKAKTTHYGYPVYSPTIYHILQTRDKQKYPIGMTAQDITKELIDKSTLRTDVLLPGEAKITEEDAGDWKEKLSGPLFASFLRNVYGNLVKAKEAGMVDSQPIKKEPGEKGKRVRQVWFPTQLAIDSGGTRRTTRFIQKPEADIPPQSLFIPAGPTGQQPEKTQIPDLPAEIKGKGAEDWIKEL